MEGGVDGGVERVGGGGEWKGVDDAFERVVFEEEVVEVEVKVGNVPSKVEVYRGNLQSGLPSWTWNFVFTRSKGKVAMVALIPATIPATAWMCDFVAVAIW